MSPPCARRRSRVAALAVLAALAPAHAGAAEYSFDLSEIEPAPYDITGFVEGKLERIRLQPDAPLFPLAFPREAPRRALDRATVTLELAANARRDRFTAYGRARALGSTDAFRTDGSATLLEGGLRFSPSEGLSVDAGKQVQRWGKGYASNPAAFFERPKDPSDPQLSREGFVMLSADGVRSLPGRLAAVGFTGVLLPVSSDLNSDYGATGHANLGARLYLLLADTDIDLMWAARGSRPQRVGLDFSRNFGSQLEVHGEWARAIAAARPDPAPAAGTDARRANADSWLLGLRYLTEREVTWIVELYRNGSGVDEEQLAAFHDSASAAFAPGGTPSQQARVRALAASGLGRAHPGRRYGYVRVSAKDPVDWLYVTPALTAIVNLQDRSAQVIPELLYTGWQNVELRARAMWLGGGSRSEFGAKAFSHRFELLLRLYF